MAISVNFPTILGTLMCITLVFGWLISVFNLFDGEKTNKKTHILQPWTENPWQIINHKAWHDSFINEIKCFNSFSSFGFFSSSHLFQCNSHTFYIQFSRVCILANITLMVENYNWLAGWLKDFHIFVFVCVCEKYWID